ncbi:uncharacterized protein LOC132757602 [Ruditapes philippinarum]|uniref:uncharacterized protein LOC132757602 n=1 Tax=Ruditapes philippinarum TaxID=129788 RepID=UPI00295B15FD|nr:uncharacterized protein LOC132757602 [Ruditapes philippinarum]
MLFKPEKSKCLVVRKGKVIYRFKLTIRKEEIPSLVNNPVKCLGKWFDSTLKDIKCQERLKQHVEEGLRRKSAQPTSTGVLYDSKNWEMLGDLGKKTKVPEEVTHTSLRPDIVMLAKSPKLKVMVELTVPWEERVEESYVI